jgi:hypothetical protein
MAANRGSAIASIASPKAALIYSLNEQTDVYANGAVAFTATTRAAPRSMSIQATA